MHIGNSLSCVFILFAGLHTKAQSQTLSNFQIGCLGFSNASTPVCTAPVIINAEACVQLYNGVALLLPATGGLFIDQCGVPSDWLHELFEIRVMPNPVSTTLIVKSVENDNKSSNPETIVLLLYDASGRLLQTHITETGSLKTGYTINVSRLPAGVYVLKAQMRGNLSIISSIIKIV